MTFSSLILSFLEVSSDHLRDFDVHVHYILDQHSDHLVFVSVEVGVQLSVHLLVPLSRALGFVFTSKLILFGLQILLELLLLKLLEVSEIILRRFFDWLQFSSSKRIKCQVLYKNLGTYFSCWAAVTLALTSFSAFMSLYTLSSILLIW